MKAGVGIKVGRKASAKVGARVGRKSGVGASARLGKRKVSAGVQLKV